MGISVPSMCHDYYCDFKDWFDLKKSTDFTNIKVGNDTSKSKDIFTRGQFWPSPCDNSSPVQARITKFGP